jgi:hypothetical protein
VLMADALPLIAQAATADVPALVSTTSATTPATAPSAVSPPPTERELTFAWGYAQRHPSAPARQTEARVVPALTKATVPKREPRRPAERQHGLALQRDGARLAPSMLFPGFARDPERALGYSKVRPADFAVSPERNLRPARATTALPSLPNHERTRS